jgi:ABC-2 type transport system permease protein
MLAMGDAALRPSTASISTASRADTLFKNVETTSPLSASLGALDLTWIAVVLLPLLLIALSHDLLAAERDTARLGLLRVQASDLRRLVWRRLALRLALPAALVSGGVIAAVGLGTPPGVGGTWWLIAVLYLFLWALVGALVSVRARTAQGAAATLLLLWLGFVVVLPASLALAIERLSPAPSRIAQVVAMREVQLSLQPRTAELLDRYLHDHPELAGASRSGFARAFFVAQRETEAQLAPVLAGYGEMRRQQVSWGARLSWLSPPMLAHGALTHVAGTDGARHEAFVRQATDFAAAWRDLLRERLFMDRMLTPEELAALPRFRFAEPPAHQRAGLAPAYLLGLVALFAFLLQRALAGAELR